VAGDGVKDVAEDGSGGRFGTVGEFISGTLDQYPLISNLRYLD
jgi:hypothetical protein